MDPRCREFDRTIEPIVAGDVEPGPAQAAHVVECERCRAALALARRVDRALASTPAAAAPAQFTARVQRRVRGEWWQSERHFDWLFNVSVAAALVLLVGGVSLLMNVSGLSAVAIDVSRLVFSGGRPLVDQLVAQVPLYAGATALLFSALGVWYWAEGER